MSCSTVTVARPRVWVGCLACYNEGRLVGEWVDIAASNLDIADFRARWLVMEDIWISLGESAMIRRHTPVWNALLDGFGNHDPGKGRINGVRSKWDTLHPGRPWAGKFPPNPESPAAVAQEVTEYLRSRLA